MDTEQESTSEAGDKESIDILKAELPDDTADSDSSQDSETDTVSESNLLAALQSKDKRTEDDASLDERAVVEFLEAFLLNALLRQENEMLKCRRRKLEAEVNVLRRQLTWLWIQTQFLRRMRDLLWIRNELLMIFWMFLHSLRKFPVLFIDW
ncbi:hypothetical protein AVEN_189715-1 [Araneus ventricosus]|uniref:Uncharacterized protein n=1 Tax=Araneus ventricosus TaxID=182803 RepID=A0A4Y2J1F7_ARAVE|nr:hypothetical protein AVEN_189715-1 [Araneus ventricosus]